MSHSVFFAKTGLGSWARACLLACVSLVAPSGAALAQASSDPGRIVGIAFVGRTVSDLDRSVAFYKALGFKQDLRANPEWRSDEVTERIYGVKGVQTRMAKMLMNSSFSGKDFAVYLREFKGLEQKTLSGYVVWEPGAPHFGLVVPDANALWAQLKASGMLRARSWVAS